MLLDVNSLNQVTALKGYSLTGISDMLVMCFLVPCSQTIHSIQSNVPVTHRGKIERVSCPSLMSESCAQWAYFLFVQEKDSLNEGW